MNPEALLDQVEPIIKNIARKYAIRGNAFLSEDDLLQEQRAKVLEIAAQPPCQGQLLVRYTLRACKRTCLSLVRDTWRKAGRHVPANVADDSIAEFLTDGTYEALRAAMEAQERQDLLARLLQVLQDPRDRKVIRELLKPSPATKACLESGGTVKQALALGSGVKINMVRKSLTHIRKALQQAA